MSALFAAGDGPYLLLYLVTLALHAGFVSYLVGGAAYVLVRSRRAGPTAAPDEPRDERPEHPADARPPLVVHIASWLPLTMGAAITAGVAPLLFLQILHQRDFYTANLLLGPVWFAMVPSLIAGFYLLYLHKSRPTFHPAKVLGAALTCFVVVACLWSWNHRVMTEPGGWLEAYRRSVPAVYGASWLPRVPLWLGGMLAQFAALAAWQAARAEPAAVPALAGTALLGRALSVLGAILLGWHRQLGEPLVLGLVVALAIDAALWLLLAWRARTEAPAALRRLLGAVTATTGAALALAVLVRELPRLASLRQLPAAVHRAGGAWLFAVFAVLAISAFALIFRAVRSSPAQERSWS